MSQKTIIVIGGGASGFFCAINLAKESNHKVIIVEKTAKLLSKVKISGGGRCNVTHNEENIPAMAKKYPRGEKFVKKIFNEFFVTNTYDWFEERGVTLKVEADNRMFPYTDDSQTIIDTFLSEAKKYRVEIQTSVGVARILNRGEQGYELLLQGGGKMSADAIVVACGGFPKTSQFEWITALGHTISEPVPSLFTFNLPKHDITELMGVSVLDAQVKIVGTKLSESGPVLITHWGLSGPAILKLSAYGARLLAEKDWQFQAVVNWAGKLHEDQVREMIFTDISNHPNQLIINAKSLTIPNRLWQYLLKYSGIVEHQKAGEIQHKLINKLVKNITNFEVNVAGKTTFKEEFVTAGGVTLSEIDADTMMSKLHKNLFFVGEIIDVDGVTGGFNFQNAWSTAFIAARTIAQKL